MKWTPKKYQSLALDFLRAHNRGGLWLPMGLGKTSTVLTRLAELFDEAKVTRVLVIAPKRVCETVWPVEKEKWDHTEWLPMRNLEGSPRRRKEMVRQPFYGIETMTYEKVKWLCTVLGAGTAGPWDAIIFDEASKMKNPATSRFKKLRARQPHFPRYVWNLTGSPAPQSLMNVWGPMFMLDHGAQLGRTYLDFQNRWFDVDHMGWRYTVKNARAEREIYERCATLNLSMRAEDWLELPDLVEHDVVVDLPAKVADLYAEMEEEMFLSLERGTVEVANGGALTNKCRQVTSGFLYVNGDTREWEDLHDAKLAALDDVVEEAEGENIIVAYQFRADLVRLRKRYPHALSVSAGGDSRATIEKWNTGNIPMLLMHPASAGHGLNLQEGGRHVVFYGMPWSYDLYSQTRDRVAGGLRRGRTTFIHRILARNTVDYDVLRAIEEKRDVQEILIERVRAARAVA